MLPWVIAILIGGSIVGGGVALYYRQWWGWIPLAIGVVGVGAGASGFLREADVQVKSWFGSAPAKPFDDLYPTWRASDFLHLQGKDRLHCKKINHKDGFNLFVQFQGGKEPKKWWLVPTTGIITPDQFKGFPDTEFLGPIFVQICYLDTGVRTVRDSSAKELK